VTTLVFVRRPAIVSSLLAPVLFVGGTMVAETLSPAYNPIRQTISELAAQDAPTYLLVTTLFVMTGICHLITAVYATGIGLPGRIAIFVAGLTTFAVAIFPLPTAAGSTPEHRYSAMIGFVLLAIWPVLGMRKSKKYPWLIRPWGAIFGTALMGIFCFWFLGVWSDLSQPNIGLVERLAADLESAWPGVVVVALWLRSRRDKRAIPIA
jgi:hypothetical membrane protein